MNINEFIEKNKELNEGIKFFKTSYVAKKLLYRLEKRKITLQNQLKYEADKNKIKQSKAEIKAIDLSVPIVKKYMKYFIKLEQEFSNLSEREKRNKIKSKYDEIKFLFLNKLYKTMNMVSRNSVYIIASALSTLLFAIIFIPGGGPVMLLPTISIIKNVNKAKEKVKDKSFKKDLDYLNKQLEKYYKKK